MLRLFQQTVIIINTLAVYYWHASDLLLTRWREEENQYVG